MPESVLYIRGPFPIEPEPGIPDGLIRDAKRVLDLEPAQIESVRGRLEAFGGFLDREKVEEFLASDIQDEETRRALARLIANVGRRLIMASQTAEQLVSHIETWLEDKENQQKGLLSREEFEQMRPRLPILLRRFPGLERQAKAERLSHATGLPLEKIDIICDVRPIFDKDRDRVEGMIPYTTLRIVCTGVDGLPVAFEAVLTQQDVKQLAKASANAEKKVSKLRELLQQKDLSVPRVDMTMETDEK
ncbi:MAG: hypothetical protein A2V98_09325 [Planctomycetes bacterium RBG_16_64_12]|nr:MAG: hypothetical protein A2V98_09325 [Planctomycetes bacterium RBG_16_64_12]